MCENSEVYIMDNSKGRPFSIREVKASYIGQLVKISGIVTRCSDVKPLMQVAVYTCEECGFEIYQVCISGSIFVAFFFFFSSSLHLLSLRCVMIGSNCKSIYASL